MFNVGVKFILICFFLLQSFVIVADPHGLHQKNTQHQVINEHVHHANTSAHINNSTEQEADCHHCCHCHGISVALPVTMNYLANYAQSNSSPKYSFDLSPNTINSLFRPPIPKSLKDACFRAMTVISIQGVLMQQCKHLSN